MRFQGLRQIALLFIIGFGQSVPAKPITIAVIGASTAAGKNLVEDGAGIADSWVNRYAAHLDSLQPGSRIVNLAVAGYNTYHGVPTGSTVPSGRPAPDPAKNITAALAANPDAIIANYVGDGGFGTTEAMANLKAMHAAASGAGIPFWVTTTQPSIAGQTAAVLAQKFSQRDSVLSKYGSHAIDFWTPLADPGGSGLGARNLIQLYDDTHPNAAGHRLLFNQVVAAGVGVNSPTVLSKRWNISPVPAPGVLLGGFLTAQGLIFMMNGRYHGIYPTK